MFAHFLSVQKLSYSGVNDQLYEACKYRGYQIPVASKQNILELPGKAERVEVAISNVLVDISSFYCSAQLFLTNYRSFPYPLVLVINLHTDV